MKLFIILAAILVAVLAAYTLEERAQWDAWDAECSKELGVDHGTWGRLLQGELNSVSDNKKCFTKCILNKANILLPDGTMNKPLAQEMMSDWDPAVVQKFYACFKPSADPCDTAFAMVRCKWDAGHREE